MGAAGDAACRLVVSLALHPTSEPTSVSTLAARTGLPPAFAGQLLFSCRRAGILSARRGRHGGYCFDIPARQVTLAEVLDAVEGPATSIPSRDGGGVREDIRAAEELATVWEDVSEAARGRLGLLTIEDIAARAAGGVPWPRATPTALQSTRGHIRNNSYGFDIVDRDSQD